MKSVKHTFQSTFQSNLSKNRFTLAYAMRKLDIDEKTMAARLKNYFAHIKCTPVEHRTPNDTVQYFTFCSFKKHLLSERRST